MDLKEGSSTGRGKPSYWGLLLLLLLVIALPIRLALVIEPLNSDDMTTFTAAEHITQGTHPLQDGLATSSQRVVNHHYFRLGFVLPVALAIELFGGNFIAYYFWPMLTSLGAIALSFLLLRRYVGPTAAFFAGLIQAVNPLEIRWSSNLLSNLPVALLCVGYVCLLYFLLSENESRRRRILVGIGAGLILFWLYFTRLSAPLLVVPACIVGLFHTRYRLSVILSGMVLLLGILGEQVLYMARGGEFLYRYHVVSNSIEAYLPQFQVYDNLRDYIFRYPQAVFQLTQSLFVEVIFYVALLAHVYTAILSRDFLLRVLSLMGLFNFGLFSFGLVGPLSEGFVTVPPMTRFIFLFLLTSVVCTTWTLCHAVRRVWGRVLRRIIPRGEAVDRVASPAFLLVCFGMLFVPLAKANGNLHGRMFSFEGKCLPILRTLDELMASNQLRDLEVTGTTSGIRTLRLFSNLPKGRRLTWRGVSVSKAIELLESKSVDAFLWNARRERAYLGYVANQRDRLAIAEQLDRIETLVREMGVVRELPGLVLASKYPSSTAWASMTPTLVDIKDLSFVLADIPGQLNPVWQLPRDSQKCRVSVAPDGWLRAECNMPGEKVYIYQDDRGFDLPPAVGQRSMKPDCLYEVQVAAHRAGDAAAQLWIIEYNAEKRVADQTLTLRNGQANLKFRSSPETMSFRVLIRFSETGAVSISPISLFERQ